jgi:hypothetical protein
MGSPVDPCLWIKHSEFGIVMVAVYVEGIQDIINCLKSCDFGLKIADNMTDYLSCKIQINQATKATYNMRPYLIKSLIDKFGEEGEDLLGVPIFLKSKAQKGVTLSSSEAEYVGMSEAVKETRFILYLLRHMFIEVKLPIMVRCDNVGAFLWPRI